MPKKLRSGITPSRMAVRRINGQCSHMAYWKLTSVRSLGREGREDQYPREKDTLNLIKPTVGLSGDRPIRGPKIGVTVINIVVGGEVAAITRPARQLQDTANEAAGPSWDYEIEQQALRRGWDAPMGMRTDRHVSQSFLGRREVAGDESERECYDTDEYSPTSALHPFTGPPHAARADRDLERPRGGALNQCVGATGATADNQVMRATLPGQLCHIGRTGSNLNLARKCEDWAGEGEVYKLAIS
ncbi:hypothetical protein FB451DRAFT_1190980 [Mycena latifolia]|nr:hypothetical protein FB451DRAFT_1190980 [Mycena latifolia]